MAPPVGLEPTTTRLTAECSTDWAKEEYADKEDIIILFIFFYSGDYLFYQAVASQVSSA